ncbi:MAG: signal peptidase I [Spirochaetes bacterium]|nr:signal peptidase I [Spirochaetota bacterium]MBU1079272.1 signal peptidase I [Spirochaetota bacterium]
MDAKTDFLASLESFTERALTRRKKRRLAQKMKQQAKHWIRDWAEAILWAVCMVLLINQYLFQMYRIPSGSMSGTLEIGDMIFVDKIVYGPELLPGVAKMPGFRRTSRGEVVVFENPAYLSKGPIFTILQQFVYMATLTLVDIDLDEAGQPRVHYLIKRAVGVGGDTVRVVDGEVGFLFRGESEWTSERDYQKATGFQYPLRRMVKPEDYPSIRRAGVARAEVEMGIRTDMPSVRYNQYDDKAFNASLVAELASAYPHDARTVAEDRMIRSGWYIPEDRVFPMGDNRDNSKDARWFGAVSLDKVLGHALFVYWPLGRLGGIR